MQVPLGIMQDVISHVKLHDPGYQLWNRTTDNFISDWCYIYFYKMITATGNTKLEKSLKLQAGLRTRHHTLHHNTQQLHEII